MLKKTLIVKHNVDLKTYCRLRAFLKTNSDGFQSKKSLVFAPEDLKNFIVDAPNLTYLGMKVITKQKSNLVLYKSLLHIFRLFSFSV